MFDHPEFDGHERVLFAQDAASGLNAYIAIHSTALGPGFGGCRFYPYASSADALTDVLRLSRGMTYKAAICDLPYGGAKAVIIGDPKTHKSEDLLLAMGRLVDSLGGAYITADDVGTTLADMAVMRRTTYHTVGASAAAMAPLAVTGYGVYCAIRAADEEILGRSDLEGLKVAVQGLGNVGMPLCGYLHKAGSSLVVSDFDAARVERAKAEFGAKGVGLDEIFDQDVDVFAPCATGAIINDETIPRLNASIVCGGANNQLKASRHDEALARRGIAFIPDYLANAGGVIDFYQESIDDSPQAVLAATGRIYDITRDVLRRAKAEARTPLSVADDIARSRLQAARATAGLATLEGA